MLKIIGTVLIVFAMSTAGSQCALILKKRVHSLEALIKMIDALEMKISAFSTPLPDFFASYKDEHLDSCGFISAVSELGLSSALASKADALFLNNDDLKLLISFADGLGALSATEESKRCRYFKCECEKLLCEAKESLPLHTKLLHSIGVMCGILMAVLLI